MTNKMTNLKWHRRGFALWAYDWKDSRDKVRYHILARGQKGDILCTLFVPDPQSIYKVVQHWRAKVDGLSIDSACEALIQKAIAKAEELEAQNG